MAAPAYGTLLQRGDGAGPEVFTTVAEVRSINGPSMEVQEEDVTTHSSAVNGAFKETMATLIDAGEIEFEINYVAGNATHQAIRADLLARRTGNWKIILPNAAQTISFAAFVKSAPYEFPTDGVMKQKITLRVTGAPTWT